MKAACAIAETVKDAPLKLVLMSSGCTTSAAIISSCSVKSNVDKSSPSLPNAFLLLSFASFRLDC